MVHRHRIPTIFNIYMLDVICCALGCVVLLWQVAHQEAEEQTAKAEQQSAAAQESRQDAERQSSLFRLARAKYETAQYELLSTSNDKTQLQALIAQLEKKHLSAIQSLEQTQKEREETRRLAEMRQAEIDKTRKALSLSEAQIKKLEDDLAAMLAANKKSTADLTGAVKVNVELLAKIALAEKQLASLKTDLTSKNTEILTTQKKWQEDIALLKISDENARKLRKLLDTLRDDTKDAQSKLKLKELELALRIQELDRARADAKVREQELAKVRGDLDGLVIAKDKLGKEASLTIKELLASKKEIAALTQQRDDWKTKYDDSSGALSSANIAIGDLKSEKVKQEKRLRDLQAEAEQRFAGVPLTGENVVFLIDMSGSMTKKDEKTEDPDKWPFLCETLMQLMRSIPTMKRFQVVLFSDKTHHLFGNRDYWLRYEGLETAKMTRDALKKFAVGGGTNMHDGFDEAFRYRKIGLDTIYLFSDGLPNIGDGLPAGVQNPTEEQLNFHLGRHVREKLKNEWNRPINGKEATRINAIGFYFESPDVGAFLWALTREHRGSFVGLR